MEEFKKYKFGDIVNILDSNVFRFLQLKEKTEKGFIPIMVLKVLLIISMITSSTVHISLLLKMAKI